MALATYLTSIVDKLVEHLVAELGCEEDAVQKALDSFAEDKAPAAKAQKAKPATPKTAAKKPVAKSTDKAKCPYEKKSGEICNVGAKIDFDGTLYCSSHAKIMSNNAAKAEKPKVPKSKTAAKKIADEKSEDLVDRVVKPKLTAKKNAWNNWEDPQHHIVFDRTTKKALGNQLPSGKIGPLTAEQISVCEANNWEFDAPPPTSVAAKNAKNAAKPAAKPAAKSAAKPAAKSAAPVKKAPPKTIAKSQPVEEETEEENVELEDIEDIGEADVELGDEDVEVEEALGGDEDGDLEIGGDDLEEEIEEAFDEE